MEIHLPLKTESCADGWIEITDNVSQVVCRCPGVEEAQAIMYAIVGMAAAVTHSKIIDAVKASASAVTLVPTVSI